MWGLSANDPAGHSKIDEETRRLSLSYLETMNSDSDGSSESRESLDEQLEIACEDLVRAWPVSRFVAGSVGLGSGWRIDCKACPLWNEWKTN